MFFIIKQDQRLYTPHFIFFIIAALIAWSVTTKYMYKSFHDTGFDIIGMVMRLSLSSWKAAWHSSVHLNYFSFFVYSKNVMHLSMDFEMN